MAASHLLRLSPLSLLLPPSPTLHFRTFSCLLSSSSSSSASVLPLSPSAKGSPLGSHPLTAFRWPRSTPKFFATSGESFEAADAIKEHTKHRRLILYSKPGCCLCDQLKQSLHTVLMMVGDRNLSDVQLEVRDITSNPHWEAAFQYQIPVLARLKADGSEEILPRFSPRLGFDQLQKKLADALC